MHEYQVEESPSISYREQKKDNAGWIKWWVSLIIALLTYAISATLFIASRPDRSEVKQMIEERVDKRMEKLERGMEVIQQDVKEILKGGNSK